MAQPLPGYASGLSLASPVCGAFVSGFAGGVQPHCFLGPQPPPRPGISRDMANQATTTAKRIQSASMFPPYTPSSRPVSRR